MPPTDVLDMLLPYILVLFLYFYIDVQANKTYVLSSLRSLIRDPSAAHLVLYTAAIRTMRAVHARSTLGVVYFAGRYYHVTLTFDLLTLYCAYKILNTLVLVARGGTVEEARGRDAFLPVACYYDDAGGDNDDYYGGCDALVRAKCSRRAARAAVARTRRGRGSGAMGKTLLALFLPRAQLVPRLTMCGTA